ncbi:unnamed protein product [Meganyctiphanes norvegica]|uniref:DM13 domain-containing protein n=1 Tax=Meganyctiphanes norvegica TaxID=48144 RepID=A0AAV2S5V9_MEGNR
MKLLVFIYLFFVNLFNESNCIMYGNKVPDLGRGALIGTLITKRHGVNGTVYALDEENFYVDGFNYDGKGADAFFWYGMDGDLPNKEGEIILYHENDDENNPTPLPAMANAFLKLALPEGTSITKDLRWLSVWSKKLGKDFGHIIIPEDLDVPRVKVLHEFTKTSHGVKSGNIEILDAQSILIPDLHYDGEGPGAYFWAGSGSTPNDLGFIIPNEKGSLEKLESYEGEKISLKLPKNVTVYDIDYIAIWCEELEQSFGYTLIPKDDLWVPPTLPQTRVQEITQIVETGNDNSSGIMCPMNYLVLIVLLACMLKM